MTTETHFIETAIYLVLIGILLCLWIVTVIKFNVIYRHHDIHAIRTNLTHKYGLLSKVILAFGLSDTKEKAGQITNVSLVANIALLLINGFLCLLYIVGPISEGRTSYSAILLIVTTMLFVSSILMLRSVLKP